MFSQTVHAGRRPRIFYRIMLLACCMLLPACSGRAPAVHKSEDIVQLQHQVQKNNEVVEELRDRISVLQFMVDNHDQTLRKLERSRLPLPETAPEAGGSSPIPSQKKPDVAERPSSGASQPSSMTGALALADPLSLYNTALGTYNARDYLESKSLFEQFLWKYPQHDLADNALYWIGECLYSRKNYLGAIDQFKKLMRQYPEGGKVPGALLKTGYAYYSLEDFENARVYLKKVIVSYPFSSAADKAEAMLKRVQ
jgi:tol-pal system protein YbgF